MFLTHAINEAGEPYVHMEFLARCHSMYKLISPFCEV
jgi:hypothetical protein